MNRYIAALLILLIGFTSCKDEKHLVIGKIKKSAQLATTQFTIDKLVYGVKDKKLFWVINLNQSRFLAQTQAIVKAGIDLDELTEKDVSIEGDKISITLPHVRVITFSYPSERFKVLEFLSKEYALNKISLKEKETFFREAEVDIRNSLKNMEIIKTTQQKTKVMFEALLRNLGYKEIYIQFNTGELIPTVDANLIR